MLSLVSRLRWILMIQGRSKRFYPRFHFCEVSETFLPSEFGLAFLDAKERCNARTRHSSFDTSVIEINKDDLNSFLENLCDGG